MATRKGLEPSTSAVTGRHSNQLNYRAIFICYRRVTTYNNLPHIRDFVNPFLILFLNFPKKDIILFPCDKTLCSLTFTARCVYFFSDFFEHRDKVLFHFP